MDTEPGLQFLEQFCNQVIEDLNESRNLLFHYIGLTRLIDLLRTIVADYKPEHEIKVALGELQCALIEIRKQLTLLIGN